MIAKMIREEVIVKFHDFLGTVAPQSFVHVGVCLFVGCSCCCCRGSSAFTILTAAVATGRPPNAARCTSHFKTHNGRQSVQILLDLLLLLLFTPSIIITAATATLL